MPPVGQPGQHQQPPAKRLTLCLDAVLATDTQLPTNPSTVSDWAPDILSAEPAIAAPGIWAQPDWQRAHFGPTDLGFCWQELKQLLQVQIDLHSWRAWPECHLPKGEALRQAFTDLRAGGVSPNLFCYTDGSYYPPGDRPARSGWSFILLDPQRATAACVAGVLPSWLLSPQDAPSAFQVE